MREISLKLNLQLVMYCATNTLRKKSFLLSFAQGDIKRKLNLNGYKSLRLHCVKHILSEGIRFSFVENKSLILRNFEIIAPTTEINPQNEETNAASRPAKRKVDAADSRR